MGANVSISQNIVKNIDIEKTVNSVSTQVSNTSTIGNTTNQTVLVVLGPHSHCGSFTSSQNANSQVLAQVQSIQQALSSSTQNIANTIADSASNAIKQANTQFNLGQVNMDESINNISTEIRKTTINTMSSYVSSMLQVTNNVDQTITATLDGTVDGACTLEQSANLGTHVKALTVQITNNIMETLSTTDLINKMQKTVDQKNEGTNLAMLSFGILGILIVGLIIYFLVQTDGAGGGASQAIAKNAAAAKLKFGKYYRR